MTSSLNYSQLLENLNTAIVVVDEQLFLLYLNPAAESLLAVSHAQISSGPFQQFFHEDEQAWSELTKAAKEHRHYTKRRATWRLPDGSQRTVDYSVSPLQEQPGLIIEIQPLDRLLKISREESLLSAQETSRNLARNMAHEIKNPLGGIRGAAQLLAKELNSDDLRDYTEVIIAEADRLRKLVDRMLGPKQPSQIVPINIHEVLERIITIVQAEYGQSIKLVKDYDPSIPELPGDIEQLIQALLNVLNNAAQSLHESNTESPCIILRSRIQRRFTIGRRHFPLVVRIDIEDNGPGIGKELLADVFYPMITGRANGTGLGLAISQQLINQHQGLIECESENGLTTFSIYLPLNSIAEGNK